MKSIELAEATQSLAESACAAADEPVVVTRGGNPIAVVLPPENADLETVSLSTNPGFLAIIERSRSRQQRDGGLSSAEVREQLGLAPTTNS